MNHMPPWEQNFYQRTGFKPPEISNEDLMRRQMATRNERKLYRRTCDATKQEIISAYHADSPFTVYKNSVWWGDTWDAESYGRDFDFNKPFFEQFAELQRVVPREGTSVFSSENCDYNSHIRESKNCYLNHLAVRGEDLMYCYWMVDNRDILDSMYTNQSTLCYECSFVDNGYDCVMLEESVNSNDCHFSFQLRGCDHCMFSNNLTNKSYYLFNKPCTKEEFESMKQKYLNGSWKAWNEALEEFQKMRFATPHRYVHGIKSENSTGDHLFGCKNCYNCFVGYEGEDCAGVASFADSKDIYHSYATGWPRCEMLYQCSVMRGCTDCAFCTYTWFCNGMRYSDSCVNSENCFGSIGMRRKKFAILNKTYSEAEYKALVPKIIEHMKKTGEHQRVPGKAEWGQFFPPNLSPFAYNESAAQAFFPLSKEEALQKGFRWRDEEKKDYLPASIASIPDSINDIPNEFIKEILACEQCGKNYRVVEKELAFYRKMHLPVPRNCPDCRHERRFKTMNPNRFFERECGQCKKPLQSTYAPDRPEKIYCEECFLAVID